MEGGEGDRETYEIARTLKKCIGDIRDAYTKDLASEDGETRLLALATYLVDRLSMETSSWKEYEKLSKYGCFAIKFEHIQLILPKYLKLSCNDSGFITEITVEVDRSIYEAIVRLKAEKHSDDFLLDNLDAVKLNSYLNELMPGLTFQVFHIYNVSVTSEQILRGKGACSEHFEISMIEMDKEKVFIEKRRFFRAALREIGPIISNNPSHCSFVKSTREKAVKELYELQDTLAELKVDLDKAKKGKRVKGADGQPQKDGDLISIEMKIARITSRIQYCQMNRDPASCLGLPMGFIHTERYIDPRVVVLWCRENEVPVEKILGKRCVAKYAWAMTVEPDFRF